LLVLALYTLKLPLATLGAVYAAALTALAALLKAHNTLVKECDSSHGVHTIDRRQRIEWGFLGCGGERREVNELVFCL
jgi:hypothetical protein